MVAQSVPLNVMALGLSSNTRKSGLSAPVYAKLDNFSTSTSDTTQPVPDLSAMAPVTANPAERAELAEIWDAALCRSQDIQFVVQKLMSSKDPKHSTAVMMKMLSIATSGPLAAGSMMSDSKEGTSTGMTESAGASLIMSLLPTICGNSRRKASITETEAIMLYKMIRDLGFKVSQDFHEYKKNINQVERASKDYEDIQKMVAGAPGTNGCHQYEMEYLLRKIRREIDAANRDARNSRDLLVTLAGVDAVDILDKQISAESQKIGQPLVAQDDIPKEEGANSNVAE